MQKLFIYLSLLAVFILPMTAKGADNAAQEIADLKRRIEELERKQARDSKALQEKTTTLAGEIEQTKLGRILPEKAELKSTWGMGPAASSVYQVKQGLSLGGYGEANYRSFVSDAQGKNDQTDMLRLISYVGYKFNDNILFNSEIEFEHGTTDDIGGDDGDDEGEVSVEFAYLDFLMDQAINARVGMVLIPMGFLNEMHEPNTFHGVLRPEVERLIIPSTWRENGFGIFGETDVSGRLAYRSYIVNGLRAGRFDENGIRDGRQKGNRALFEDVAWTSRVDYSPDYLDGSEWGASFWFGNSGQDETFAGEEPNVQTLLGETHVQYHREQLELRALGAWGSLDDTELLSTELGETVADYFYGWYVEAAYNILPHLASESTHYLAPFFRFESFDTQAGVPDGFTANESLDKTVYTAGLTYKPIPNVVLKLDYRNIGTDGESETADEVAFGMGFAF